MNVEILIGGLEDPDDGVREAAREGLRNALPQYALEVLLEAQKSSATIQAMVVDSLWGVIGGNDPDYEEVREELIGHLLAIRAGSVRAAVVRVFRSVIDVREDVLDYVLGVAENPTTSEVPALASALEPVSDDPRAREILEALATNRDASVRQLAFRSLYGPKFGSKDQRTRGGFVIANEEERAEATRSLTDLEDALRRIEDSLPEEIVDRLRDVVYPLIAQLISVFQQRADNPSALQTLRSRAGYTAGRVLEAAETAATLARTGALLTPVASEAVARAGEILSRALGTS